MASDKSFRNPHNLPTKVCVVCNRPFTWRKKWENCWDEVKCCSKRCQSERKSNRKKGAAEGGGGADEGLEARLRFVRMRCRPCHGAGGGSSKRA